jgi:hypothetical protein
MLFKVQRSSSLWSGSSGDRRLMLHGACSLCSAPSPFLYLSLFNNSVFYRENWLFHVPFAVQYWCSIFRMNTKWLKYKGNIEIPCFPRSGKRKYFELSCPLKHSKFELTFFKTVPFRRWFPRKYSKFELTSVFNIYK